ncbi:hypothetical protein CP533_3512 [Ophiocordyceps camponoti-saundersi (nom. inval.)]|nr:hypothetical protein CP533_3512 [Ophiocordyceps camponoti-saundersi (nom. inval.)]
MSKSTSSSWVGAPPVTADGFAFAEGVFFAEASGQNRHPRASNHEIKTHFSSSGSERDYPAHWFEAQLIHYGLKPSKNKAVARTRLLDALNAGALKVPSSIAKLEGDLKKEWTKLSREAKRDSQSAGKSASSAAGVKRKTASTPEPASKKTKTTARSTPVKTAARSSPAKKRANDDKNVASTAVKQSPARSASFGKDAASQPPVRKQVTRCTRGGGSRSQGLSRDFIKKSSSPPAAEPRRKQTARRSDTSMARGRITAPNCARYGNQGDDGHNYVPEAPQTHSVTHRRDSNALRPLGLLNGSYDVDCPYVTSEWPRFGSDFGLSLTLAGRKLWGSFDLGVISGVLYFPERPWKSSTEPIPFLWRGGEDDGPIRYGDDNEGFIRFLGDGRVEGEFDYMSISFTADRVQGQGTKSDIDAATLKKEWDDYSEERYEEENRSRWF